MINCKHINDESQCTKVKVSDITLSKCMVATGTLKNCVHQEPDCTHNPSVDYTSQFGNIVRKLVKPGQDVIEGLSVEKADLWHVATGVSGEAGELLDAVKKHVIYGKELDHENMIEELGDLEFYMERIRQLINVERHETLTANIDKLAKRYPGSVYSNESAINRADKCGEK